MTDASPATPVPEPTEQDEELALAFLRVKDDTDLRGTPDGHQRCGTCHYVQDADQAISWCWHEDLELPVGRSWWCERWARSGEPDDEASAAQHRVAVALHASTVVPEQWRAAPVDGQQCCSCRYYLDPEDSVSYCWRPGMQVGVGFDHWCRGWDAPPAAL